MERKFLEEFGLEKEAIDQILNKVSTEIGAKLSEITDLQTKVNTAEEKLTKANETITALNKSNKDNEDLQKQIQSYKSQIDELNAKHNEALIKNYAVLEFQKLGALDAELMVHTIDLSKGSISKDGAVIGISEQIEAVKNDESRSGFFKAVQTEAPVEVDRGGFNPNDSFGYSPEHGESDGKISIGSMMAKEISQSNNGSGQSLSEFWSQNMSNTNNL